MPVTSQPMLLGNAGPAPSVNKALLHFDGADGATVTTDVYQNTVLLTTSSLSTAHPKFGPAGVKLSATGAVCKITGPTSLGSNGWTLEQWAYWDSIPSPATLFSAINDVPHGYGAYVYLMGTGSLASVSVNLSTGGTSNDLSGTAASFNISTGVQHHFALTRDPATSKHWLFVDGQPIYGSTNTSTTQLNAITKIYVGNDGDLARPFIGWIDEFRFSNVCRYPGGTTFTPSTAAFTS